MPNPIKTDEEMAKAVDEANAAYTAAYNALDAAKTRKRKLESELSDALLDVFAAITRADAAFQCVAVANAAYSASRRTGS